MTRPAVLLPFGLRPHSSSTAEITQSNLHKTWYNFFRHSRSNAAAKYIVKYDLQRLANSIGLPIRVAHYPSYCSKYNPIERRVFPHVSRACTGKLFKTLDRAVTLMRNAATSTGLRTTVNVIRRVYETGRNATEEIKHFITDTVQFEDTLPKWNYTLIPQT